MILVFSPIAPQRGGTEIEFEKIAYSCRSFFPQVKLEVIESRDRLLEATKKSFDKLIIIISQKDVFSELVEVVYIRNDIFIISQLFDPHLRHLQGGLLYKIVFRLLGAQYLHKCKSHIGQTVLDRNRYLYEKILVLNQAKKFIINSADKYVLDTIQGTGLRVSSQYCLSRVNIKNFHEPPVSVAENRITRNILFVGRLEGWKGQSLIHLIKYLSSPLGSAKEKKICIHVVGDGCLKGRICSLPMSKNIEIKTYGAVYNVELESILNMIYQVGGVYVGNGTAAMQAAAFKLPVLKLSIPDVYFFEQPLFGLLCTDHGDLGVYRSDARKYGYRQFDGQLDYILKNRSAVIRNQIEFLDKFSDHHVYRQVGKILGRS